MNRQKIVFIVPGFGHKPSQKGYRELSQRLRKDGYRIISSTIPWRASTISENTKFFHQTFEKKLAALQVGSKDVYILGFSYGALIAFLTATKMPVKGLILCSLSPFFKEDLPKTLPKNSSTLQQMRYKNFSSLHSIQLAKKVKSKSVMMLYGEKESSVLINRSKRAFRAIASKKKYLFSIQKADHNIADARYVSAVHFATSFL